jgi:peroxiredoxin
VDPESGGEWVSAPKRRWLVVLAAFVLIGGGLSLASRLADDAAPGASKRPLPTFSLRGFDGTQVTQAALAGKPAVINFFASTCVFCIHEMPAFERVHQRTTDVTFLGIALRDSEPAARELARHTEVTYRLAFDDEGSFYRALGGLGMPVTVFVTAGGMVATTHSGPLDEAQLEELIAEAIAST